MRSDATGKRWIVCFGAVVNVTALIATTGSFAHVADAESWRGTGNFSRGRQLFVRRWTPAEGLGPSLNAVSCASCHTLPSPGGSGTDHQPLVALSLSRTNSSSWHIVQRLRVSENGAFTPLPLPADVVLRRPPALYGSGLIEAIPQKAIAEFASPDDRDGDDISGRVGAGRFGWKAQFASLEQVISAAFANELGLESADHPGPNGRIEITPDQIRLTAEFVRSLAQPRAKAVDRATKSAGREVFNRIGCAKCHRPSFEVPAAPQGGRAVRPYTDLLLHDLGPALADGIEEGAASGQEFRTAPLWGVGVTGPPYLHDGRAKTLHEAITAHAGEAERVTAAYHALTASERQALLKFLQSL